MQQTTDVVAKGLDDINDIKHVITYDYYKTSDGVLFPYTIFFLQVRIFYLYIPFVGELGYQLAEFYSRYKKFWFFRIPDFFKSNKEFWC